MFADYWRNNQSKGKPLSHLALAKLPLQYFCLIVESKASSQYPCHMQRCGNTVLRDNKPYMNVVYNFSVGS